MNRKGIILAGGYGTRMYPINSAVSKHLLPIYDKPLIYYSITTLMLANIRDILIICTIKDKSLYKQILGDGSNFGINLSYKVQQIPNGIAEAFIIGEEFIGNNKVALILGDNLFFGQNLQNILKGANNSNSVTVFSYNVSDPKRFGILKLNKKNKPIKIVEKPKSPNSNKAVTGLYFYNKDVIDIAKKLKPSNRGELEITDINNFYIKKKKLNLVQLGRGYSWLDCGTYDSLIEASFFVKTIQERQGLMIGCPEEVGLNKKWIDKLIIKKNLKKYNNNAYASYLLNLIETL